MLEAAVGRISQLSWTDRECSNVCFATIVDRCDTRHSGGMFGTTVRIDGWWHDG